VEKIPVNTLKNPPVRVALPNAPAPTSRILEKEYYFTAKTVANAAKKLAKNVFNLGVQDEH